VLLFSLNRFDYDMSTYQRVKLVDKFTYPFLVSYHPPWPSLP
jgi:hypothetical protein